MVVCPICHSNLCYTSTTVKPDGGYWSCAACGYVFWR